MSLPAGVMDELELGSEMSSLQKQLQLEDMLQHILQPGRLLA